MKIAPIHYAAMRKHVSADVLQNLIGAIGEAEYASLTQITRNDLFTAGSKTPLMRLEAQAALLRAVRPSTAVCSKDELLGLVWDGSTWKPSTVCPECAGLMAAPTFESRFDWIAGVVVGPDVTEHVRADLRVSLDISRYEIDPLIREAAELEQVSVERLLHQLLLERADGDVRKLLANIGRVPAEWSMLNGLRLSARAVHSGVKPQPEPEPTASPQPAGSVDVNSIVEEALNAGLADPEKRDLLLYGISRPICASLPRFSRPSDQLRSDVRTLASQHPQSMAIWANNAAQQTFYHHSQYFRRVAQIFRST